MASSIIHRAVVSSVATAASSSASASSSSSSSSSTFSSAEVPLTGGRFVSRSSSSSSSPSSSCSRDDGGSRRTDSFRIQIHSQNAAAAAASSCFLSSAQCLSPCRVPLSGAFRSSSFSRRRQARQHGAVCMVLPTGAPVSEEQGTGPQGHPAWSARAIKSFSMSELEARKLKYPTTGTESLLMGILTEGTSYASRFLRASGVTLFGVREETIKVLGKADMYFFSPEHPPLTEQAQKALDWAIAEKTSKGAQAEVTASYMLVGIWNQKGSAGQRVLEALGFDDKKAEELLASVSTSYD